MSTDVVVTEGWTLVTLADGAADLRGATADVRDAGEAVQVHFHVCGGQVSQTLRRLLVDAVFALPELHRHRTLLASVPIGDAELIDQLRRRCGPVRSRAAGSTCLIEADLTSRTGKALITVGSGRPSPDV